MYFSKRIFGRKGKRKCMLSDDEIQFISICQNFLTDQELANLLGLKRPYLCHLKLRYKIKKQEQVKWTKKEVQFLLDHYKTKGDTWIGKKLERTKKSIRKKRMLMDLNRTDKEIFDIMSKNGKRISKEIKEGKVKKRDPHTWHKEGEKWFQECSNSWKIRVNGKEYEWHRWRYKQLHRKIPKKHLVVFADGDKMNTSDYNLVLMSREEHAAKYSSSTNLTNGYLAAMMSIGNSQLKEYLLKNRKDLLELKKLQLEINREIKKLDNP